MKYCISCRQPAEILEKADEIRVQENDWRYIPELFVKYPDKTIILDIISNEISEEDLLNLSQGGNLVCALSSLRNNYMPYCIKNNIKFYYKYPVSTFYEVAGLIELNVAYINVMAPLTFNIKTLQKLGGHFRMVPNVAYDAYIPREDGICGQWVRPEDVADYECGIEVFDFEDADLLKERTLFKVYSEDKSWPGDLDLLITNLGTHIDNKGLPDDFGKTRSNCRQMCQETGNCHYCQSAIRFIDAVKQWRKDQKHS